MDHHLNVVFIFETNSMFNLYSIMNLRDYFWVNFKISCTHIVYKNFRLILFNVVIYIYFCSAFLNFVLHFQQFFIRLNSFDKWFVVYALYKNFKYVSRTFCAFLNFVKHYELTIFYFCIQRLNDWFVLT